MTLSSNIVRVAARSLAVVAGLFLATASQAQQLQSWMKPDVGTAWSLGYQGQNTSITVIDQFNGSGAFSGNFDGTIKTMLHGQWTSLEAGLIAPRATIYSHDFGNSSAVTLRSGFNVLNLSYGMLAQAGFSTIAWNSRETSIISHARNGRAVVVKAAGNDGVAIAGRNASGQVDYLARDLIGAQSAIFVGALSRNGTTSSPASLASYSNRAGSNTTVQRQFLVVGVESSKTGLAGTSFAAPIVSGYASILSSKFTTATPTQIKNQLLNTARTDTIRSYSASVHGRGEASIARALAPASIN